MAKKQSLVGICFAGVQKLQMRRQMPPEMLYLKWMGMAAKIQQRNEVVNRQCIELHTKLAADGFRSCILKGQGIAQFYPEFLRSLRQSGDIDIWVDGERDEIIEIITRTGVKTGAVDMKHWDVHFFDDTEVEVHFRPTWFYSPIHDRRFMKWVTSHKKELFVNSEENRFISPSREFNLCFLLIHIYRHLFEEGIGLRQLLDYYFVLLASNEEDRKSAYDTVCKLGMKKFAAAVMYVLQVILGLKEDFMLCGASLKQGKELLEEIMIGGNFGKFDTRFGERRKGRLSRGFNTIERNMRFFCSYPSEILWSPVWKIWHWCWRWKMGYLKMK